MNGVRHIRFGPPLASHHLNKTELVPLPNARLASQPSHEREIMEVLAGDF